MFKPEKSLLAGIRNAFPLQLFPWDDYFPRMAEADVALGRGDMIAVKSYFIRTAPFGGSYALLGGITDGLRTINDLPLDDPAFQEGMKDMWYGDDFRTWLADHKRLRVKVLAPPEGTPFFPNEPIVTVRGPLPDIRLAEGILTEAMNFASLSLTKWYRLVRTVRPGSVMEFSRRRAQNDKKSALYGLMAGCGTTSNAELRRFFDVKVVGTMGHEWIQSWGDPALAFKKWLDVHPGRPIGLVDTLDCMRVDFPAWLDAVRRHAEAVKNANPAIWGWRNDSGDLVTLALDQYIAFFKHELAHDPWFAERMRIVLTNELDEYTANEIIAQIRTQAGAAGLDAEDILRRIIWAAGTKPGTCEDQPSIGGVMKLMEIDGKSCIKLAFDADGRPGIKTSIPGFNRSAVIRDAKGDAAFLLIYPAKSDFYAVTEPGGSFYDIRKGDSFESVTGYYPDTPGALVTLDDYSAWPQQELVYDSLKESGFTDKFRQEDTIGDVARRIQREVDGLHWSHSRLVKPATMKVLLDRGVYELRRELISRGVLTSDKLFQ